jgi:hypothetical protein
MAQQISFNMLKMRANFAILVSALFALNAFGPAAAFERNWMNETSMQRAFSGKTLTGRYATGTPFTETYKQDGSIVYWDPGLAATGYWRVSKQGFCTFYDDMNGGCFLAQQIGENCFEFYLVESQDSGPLPSKESEPYIAQGWYPDKTPTCEVLAT